jgi:hypothetical protein
MVIAETTAVQPRVQNPQNDSPNPTGSKMVNFGRLRAESSGGKLRRDCASYYNGKQGANVWYQQDSPCQAGVDWLDRIWDKVCHPVRHQGSTDTYVHIWGTSAQEVCGSLWQNCPVKFLIDLMQNSCEGEKKDLFKDWIQRYSNSGFRMRTLAFW